MRRDGHEPLATDENQIVTPTQTTEEKEPDRGQWTGQFDFLMSMIAYAVGLGEFFFVLKKKINETIVRLKQ
ncbi:unnamed protein product [Heligmosomoides polygyrus]|uniref:Ion_trans_2 domain-containing protein n=1 Tax=Heligmosomoides polygyrus TaxID=6339 RepID=A0A183GBT9_HELPZ|nr:unnamed protein product [Heligmosomoides polygyrus]